MTFYFTVGIEKDQNVAFGFPGTCQSSSNKTTPLLQSDHADFVRQLRLDVAIQLAVQFYVIAKIINK